MAVPQSASASEVKQLCDSKGITPVIGKTLEDPGAQGSKVRAFLPNHADFEFEYVGAYDESSLEGSSAKEVATKMATEAGVEGGSQCFSASASAKMERHGFSKDSAYWEHKKVYFVYGNMELQQFPPPFASLDAEFREFLLQAEPEVLFSKCGVLVAKGVKLGGYADLYFSTTDSEISSSAAMEAKVEASYGAGICGGAVSAAQAETHYNAQSDLKADVSIRGGDIKKYKPFKRLAEQQEWIDTLLSNPVRIQTLTAPIWDLLPFSEMDRRNELEKAAMTAEPEPTAVLEPVFDFWHQGNKDHTFHMGEPWSSEKKMNVQFYAFRDQVPGTEPVFDFWNQGDKEHTFHMGEPWSENEKKMGVQFYAFRDQVPGTEPVFNFWHQGNKDHTFHMGEPWSNEKKMNVQFYAYAQVRVPVL